tara:strand:- start:3156 stop:3755 length:600 start_codon:yes stop_codon:yes gene_type:complete
MFKGNFSLIFLCVFFSCSPPKKPSYIEIIQSKRDFIEISFRGPNSPLQTKDKESFSGLSYYSIDSNFRVSAKVKWNLDVKPIRLIKDTSISSLYYPSASISFLLNKEKYELTGYTTSLKNITEIFVPFYDLTSGKDTYSGGRFLEVKSDKSDKVFLDFNLAYNPYCVYNPNYTCAVPPFTNDLNVYILAGEKIPSFLKN